MIRLVGILCVLSGAGTLGACSDSLPDVDDGSPGGDSTTSPDLGDDASSGCQEAPDGQVCGDGRICVSGQCALSRCGDGFVDRAAGEDCDDTNAVPFDGCEPGSCAFTCTGDDGCGDGNRCNGMERCALASHSCQAGDPVDPNAPCTTSSGADGLCRVGANEGLICVDTRCGDGDLDSDEEECDDGNQTNDDGCDNDCTFSCSESAHCDDGDPCNGEETCNPSQHTCSDGEELICNDGSPCTADRCNANLGGCVYELIDKDNDGHAPRELGACGTDCDDKRNDINPDQPELCDDVDHNCDGDPENQILSWYVDCDGDSYADQQSDPKEQCTAPPASDTGCGGGWTTRAPTDTATIDCQPQAGDVHPGQTLYSAEAIVNPPVGGKFDYNCDKEQEQRYTNTAGSCSYKPPKQLPCSPLDPNCWCYRNADACLGSCSGGAGWTSSTVPSCGDSGDYRTCNSQPLLCNYAKPAIGCQLHCLGTDSRCCNPKLLTCNVSCVPGFRGCALWCEPNTPGCAWVLVRCNSATDQRAQSCR